MTDPNEQRDPFEALAAPLEVQEPRPAFRRQLRQQLAAALGVDDAVPVVSLPGRKPMTAAPTTTAPPTPAVATPYLAVDGGAAALDWYTEALGAEELFRVVGDDGRLGHAEFVIGAARFMLSDEYPEIGVVGPRTLGGTAVAIHLSVPDVDTLFARALRAGATSQREPADQPHGARHGTLIDPFGHRWMLSQEIEAIDLDTYAERSDGSGFTVEPGTRAVPSAGEGTDGGIWAAVSYRDAVGGIRFLVDVFGFEEKLVVLDESGQSVVHSELRWPEGGIVQVGTWEDGNPFLQEPGAQGLYVVTRDPWSVWARCQTAGVEVVRPPEAAHYDPEGMGFSVRDPEGNMFSFGTYAG